MSLVEREMLRQNRQAFLTVQITQVETTLSKHSESCQAKHSEAEKSLNLGRLCPSRTLPVHTAGRLRGPRLVASSKVVFSPLLVWLSHFPPAFGAEQPLAASAIPRTPLLRRQAAPVHCLGMKTSRQGSCLLCTPKAA